MTLRAKDCWVNTYFQHTAKGIPELAEASCRGTTAHVGMRALGYDRLQLGMLHSFLALLPLLHSQLKPDGGGQREDLTPEPTSYQVQQDQAMHRGTIWILDKKIIPRGILKISFKLRVSQPLCCWFGFFFT